MPAWISTISIIALMGLVNIIGIQQSSWFNTTATVITLLGLTAVVVFAFRPWARKRYEDAANIPLKED